MRSSAGSASPKIKTHRDCQGWHGFPGRIQPENDSFLDNHLCPLPPPLRIGPPVFQPKPATSPRHLYDHETVSPLSVRSVENTGFSRRPAPPLKQVRFSRNDSWFMAERMGFDFRHLAQVVVKTDRRKISAAGSGRARSSHTSTDSTSHGLMAMKASRLCLPVRFGGPVRLQRGFELPMPRNIAQDNRPLGSAQKSEHFLVRCSRLRPAPQE